ncbi:MAG: GntR family transcriptional regulator [Spirochaetota bacterium]
MVAVEYLQEKIISKAYKPGDFISEADVASELKISRGPVRKALLTLESEGLAEIHANGRTIVLGLSQKYLTDMYDLRMMLEKEAVLRIIEQDFTDFSPLLATFKKMLEISEENKSANEISEANKKLLVELDYTFHSHLMSLSENRALYNAWKTVNPLMRTLMLQNIDLISIEIKRHKIIMDSLMRKEKECIDILQEHLIGAKNKLLKIFYG